MASKKAQKNNYQNNVTLRTVIVKSLLGSAVCIVLFFAVLCLVGFICFKNNIDDSAYRFIIPCIGALSSFIGGITAVHSVKKNGMITGALTAFIPYIVILATSVLLNKPGMSLTAWILLCVMTVMSAIGGILSANSKK